MLALCCFGPIRRGRTWICILVVRIFPLVDTEASCSISQNIWEAHNRTDETSRDSLAQMTTAQHPTLEDPFLSDILLIIINAVVVAFFFFCNCKPPTEASLKLSMYSFTGFMCMIYHSLHDSKLFILFSPFLNNYHTIIFNSIIIFQKYQLHMLSCFFVQYFSKLLTMIIEWIVFIYFIFFNQVNPSEEPPPSKKKTLFQWRPGEDRGFKQQLRRGENKSKSFFKNQ